MTTLLTLTVNALPKPARRALVRADPGMVRTARGTRAMFAFILTLLLCFAVAIVAKQPILSFLVGFPVTVFSCAVVGDDQLALRLRKTAALALSAGLMFTLSALLHQTLLNHGVFILVVGVAAYLRQYGREWAPAALAANVSYFFASFLHPDPAQLHWQWVSVVIGAASALIVHQLVVPHRPWRRFAWAAMSLRMRLAKMARMIAALNADSDRSPIRAQLRRVMTAGTVAEGELDNLKGGRLAHRPLAEALLQVLALAERLALQAERDLASIGDIDLKPAIAQLGQALLHKGPMPDHGLLRPMVEALNDLQEAAKLPPDLDAAQSVTPPPEEPKEVVLRPGVQSAAATLLAILGGTALSPERWYWAVITVFVMFTGTYSRGQALFKSLQRTAGTFAGIVAAMVLAWIFNGNPVAALVLMPVAIFCIFYAFTQSYTWMAFFITVVVGLLFSTIGEFTDALMLLRLEETAIGALAGIIVAAVVLPRSTDAYAREQYNKLLDAVERSLEAAFPGGRFNRLVLTAAIHDFEEKAALLRDAIAPLRLVPWGRAPQQHGRLRHQLDLTSYWLHEVALFARRIDREGLNHLSPVARRAARDLSATVKMLRAADAHSVLTPSDEALSRTLKRKPLPPISVDPMVAMAQACDGLKGALNDGAWLLTDRGQQATAFRF
ncbi:putative membrane protein YccC [Stakelama sediminis]|uniref:Putative membrane protein YccC n=1 Tax=Stakelama sediminis TaxID=463200 RepID=A0A840Z1C0_9SPHN|nr:putative membrane protein YccC [Stakelama sediminis]